MTSLISKLPPEIHSSAHQIRQDQSLLGEYEMRIYRGTAGPVVILEAGSNSPMPMEYLSERAVSRFLETLPNETARFFERHVVNNQEIWMEVGYTGKDFFRFTCAPSDLTAAVASRKEDADQALVGAGRIQGAYSARRP